MLTKLISILFIPCSLLFIFFLSGCENNIETIKNITNAKDIPQVSANDMEILYSDSAHVKMKVITKQLNRYNTRDKQYYEFPKGITVFQYDSALTIIAVIRANYAIYKDNIDIWEARNDVVAKNMIKNEQLFTEELFWNKKKVLFIQASLLKLLMLMGFSVAMEVLRPKKIYRIGNWLALKEQLKLKLKTVYLKIREYVWLSVAILCAIAGIHQTIKRDISKSYLFFVFAIFALLFYWVRRNLRNNEKAQK